MIHPNGDEISGTIGGERGLRLSSGHGTERDSNAVEHVP